MATAFDQPHCPAAYASPNPPTYHSNSPAESMHNDALVYLAVAVASFAAVPTLFWLKDRRHKARERRRNRAVVESLKAKMDAARAIDAAKAEEATQALEAAKGLETVAPPAPVSETSAIDEHNERDAEEAERRKKRSKDRRKRGREPSRTVKSKKPSASSRVLPATEYTPRAPDQSRFSSDLAPEESHFPPAPMPDIASPTPVSIIPASFHSPPPSLSRSETSSQPRPSRSVSVSPTTAPLTPPSLPASHTLLPIVKTKDVDSWAAHLPRDDPAWDWDGQSSTYSREGSCAPSSRAGPKHRDILGSPPSPASASSMPAAPSLVFPSLNAHPPPGASQATQIASLKGALEASRTREDMHRRDAERWSKECDLIKWRWNEAGDVWRRREAELQAQIHHLMHQLHTLTHAMQATSLSPTVAPFAPGQSPFPLAMPFPSHHNPSSPYRGMHPFDHRPPSAASENVNEGLAEAILKRPGSIRPQTASNSRSGMRRGGSRNEDPCPSAADVEPKSKPVKKDTEEVVEFEFPTLLERRILSPRTEPDRETVISVDGVDIFN